MAAASPMYNLKPINTEDDVQVPDVMYKLKRLHGSLGTGDVSSEIKALENRQDNILDQLKKLKAEVDALVSCSNKPPGAEGKLWEIQVQPCQPFAKSAVVQDIVITADPARPPLSIILLCNMLRQQYKVFTTCFTHSSIQRLVDSFKGALGDSNGVDRNSADMAISLIWKQNFGQPALSTSEADIQGEAVIARYLARLLKQRPSQLYEAGHLAAVTEQDYFMDLFSDIVYGSAASRLAAVDVVQKKLSSAQFLGGTAASLADMVLVSAVTQCDPSTQLPSALTTWQRRCMALPEFKPAQTVV